ncbi:thiamine ABC transporter ATP-binding protein [Parasalinivibrio latis]|uniref:thiamine ABC transporter ATP-binding protein n=1 Tax=Parasalinivibrio latis TaxID=2952610 RepID=UPI0030E2C072
MLTAKNLTYRYQQADMVFDFDARQGEIIAVLGPSGAGKSTLLSLLAGMLPASSGTLGVNGEDITRKPAHLRPLTMLFQEHNLFPHLSVGDNIALGIAPDLSLSTEQKSAVHAAAVRVGLDGYLKRLPGELSGGQRQRVALARSLVRERPLLLLDEPFSALDPALRKDMLGLVKALSDERQTTVIMVTHSPDDARSIADRFLFIENGKIQLSGQTGILNDPPEIMQHYLIC